MFGFIVALVSGALMSIQGVFNTEVTKQTGTWLTNSFVQFTGFLLCPEQQHTELTGNSISKFNILYSFSQHFITLQTEEIILIM